MSREQVRRDLALALEALYEDGCHTFWDVFDTTPLAAVAAFLKKPEEFGQIDDRLVGVNRTRLLARAGSLAQMLLPK